MAQLAFQTQKQYREKSETLFRGVGQEAKYLKRQFAKVYDHLTYPMSRQDDLHKFCNLAVTWKEETKFSSSIRDIALNPSYMEIIGMGGKVIPFILHDLTLNRAHWFPALRALTGFSPVIRVHWGNVKEMTKDWLNWGKENGYI